jgi:shikimate kinase
MNLHGRSIVLIGMMGAGKSAVGRCLKRRTGLALLDTDEIVSARFGMSIPEIFAKHGENKFREAEAKALRALAMPKQTIIVTGGGIILRQENVELLQRMGVIVWLDGNEDTLFARASRERNRPLLQIKNPKKTFSQIFDARRSLYADIADVRVDTSALTDEEIALAILSKLGMVSSGSGSSSSPAT